MREKSSSHVQKKLGTSHEMLFNAESVCLWTLQSKGKLVPFGRSRNGSNGDNEDGDSHHNRGHHHHQHHQHRQHRQHRHHRHHRHHQKQIHSHHHHSDLDWMQSDVGPAGHCLATGDIVNLTTASGTYGRNCGVNIISVNPIVVNSVLCCPVEVQGRRIGVLQVINKKTGSFDLASDIETVQLVSLLLSEWIGRWDLRHQLQSIELACATLRSSSRKKLFDMRKHLKNISIELSQQNQQMHQQQDQQMNQSRSNAERQRNLKLDAMSNLNKSNAKALQHERNALLHQNEEFQHLKHDWEENMQHKKELEQLHRLDHVLRHGVLSRAFRQIQKYAWYTSSDATSKRKEMQMIGLSRIRTAFQNILGLHSVRRYGMRWGFEMLRKNIMPLKMREMLDAQNQELGRKREILRIHGIKIRRATEKLKRYVVRSGGGGDEKQEHEIVPEVKISRRGSVNIHIPGKDI